MATPHLDRNENLGGSQLPDSGYFGRNTEDLADLYQELQEELRQARDDSGAFYLTTSRGKRRVVTVEPDPRHH